MSFEIQGKLIAKYDTQQVSDKFKKRGFVLELREEINGNWYTNYAKLQAVQNKCDLLDRFNEGDEVKVTFNIKGNFYEDRKDGQTKYITNLDAWRIEAASQSQPQHNPPVSSPNIATANSFNPSPETADDLPF
jgi:hypothetical protein